MVQAPSENDTSLDAARRDVLIGSLEMWASPGDQAKYQEEVPIAYVPSELVAQWDSIAGFGYLDSIGEPNYSEDEVRVLRAFHATLNDFCEAVQREPPLSELQKTPEYQVVKDAAIHALSAFSSNAE